MNTLFRTVLHRAALPALLAIIPCASIAQPPTIVVDEDNSAIDTQFSASVEGENQSANDGTFSAASIPDNHGKGGVFTDLNGNGYPDLYLIRGHRYAQHTSGAANQLWLNRPANPSDPADPNRIWELVNNGAEDQGAGVGAIAGDFDNDGLIDLYVVNYNEPNVLLRNLGSDENDVPAFADVTAHTVDPEAPGPQMGVGLAAHNGVLLDATFTAVWADFNRDGALDLFVSSFDPSNGVRAESFHKPPGAGERSTLYLNMLMEMTPQELAENGGVPWFRDVTMTSGGDLLDKDSNELPDPEMAEPDERIASPGVTAGSDEHGRHNTPTDYHNGHMASIVADLNNDGWPDIVVVSSVTPSEVRRVHLYRNLGWDDGADEWAGFELETFDGVQTSPAGHLGSEVVAPMGITAGDYNNNGKLDLFITSIHGGINDVLINQSNSSTLEFHHQDALPTVGTAWGAEWADLNNDRMLDLVVATQGNVPSGVSAPEETPRHDWLFINNWISAGEHEFIEDGFDSGLIRADDSSSQKSLGLMIADYDRDGFVDVFARGFATGNQDQLWRNISATHPTSNTNNWVAFRLIGNPELPGPEGWRSTRDAIGARVKITDSATFPGVIFEQIREVRSGASNAASTSSLYLHFGLGEGNSAFVEITWPSGRTQNATVNANKFYVVEESDRLGDLNCDNWVDGDDVQLMLEHWGPCPDQEIPCIGDLNDDGVVDQADMDILLDNMGT